MLEYIIPLIDSYISSGIFNLYWWYILALALLATVPVLIRVIVLRRSHV